MGNPKVEGKTLGQLFIPDSFSYIDIHDLEGAEFKNFLAKKANTGGSC